MQFNKIKIVNCFSANNNLNNKILIIMTLKIKSFVPLSIQTNKI